jgi:hypothetical protein
VHNIKNAGPCYGSDLQKRIQWAQVLKTCQGNDFEVLSYGKFTRIEKKENKKIVSAKRKIRKNGLLGLIGLKRKTEVEEEQILSEYFVEPSPISNYVANGNEDPGYFLNFSINSLIKDNFGRDSPNNPNLTLVCGEHLKDRTVEFVKENPERYLELLREVLNEEKFPNVNRNILGNAKKTDLIYLLNSDNVPDFMYLVSSDSDKCKEFAETYGELVSV